MSARTYSNGVRGLALYLTPYDDRTSTAEFIVRKDARPQELPWDYDGGHCLDAPDFIPPGSVRFGGIHCITYTYPMWRGI